MPADDRAFQALADPTRRQILRLVGTGNEPTVGEIAAEVPNAGRTAVSAHLRVLRLADLVHERRDGKYRRYSLTNNHADDVVDYLTEVYRTSLGALKSAAERSDDDDEAAGDGRSRPPR